MATLIEIENSLLLAEAYYVQLLDEDTELLKGGECAENTAEIANLYRLITALRWDTADGVNDDTTEILYELLLEAIALYDGDVLPIDPEVSVPNTVITFGIPVAQIQALIDASVLVVQEDLDTHEARTDNPHAVTKTQVGLSNVDNTSDANKPVSTAQATAIAVVQTDIDNHEARVDNPHTVTKTQVGLGNADNTSDINKPVSTATQTALDLKQSLSAKNQANGYAGLDSGALLPLSLFPDSVLGNLKYGGTYNGTVISASDDFPELNGQNLPTSGYVGVYFIATAQFTRASVTYDVGDWIVHNGSNNYVKVDNSDAVTTVFGRIGNVVANTGDYTTAQVTESVNLYYTEARVNANTEVGKGVTAFGWGNHAGLYPLYNGTGATGTWGIGISGNAATASTSPLWNGYPLNISSASVMSHLLSYDQATTTFRPAQVALVQAWLGMTAGANVVGAASSTDNAIVRFDGTTGKLIQNSGTSIDDAGNITANSFIKAGGAASQFLKADGGASGLVLGDIPSLSTLYLPLTAGSGSPLSGTIISNVGNAGMSLNSTSATNNYTVLARVSNSTGVGSIGMEGTTVNTLMTGSLANSFIVQSIGVTPLQFGTNQTARYTIDASGNNTWTGTGTFGGDLTTLHAGTVLNTLQSTQVTQTVGNIYKSLSKEYFTGLNYSTVDAWEVYDVTSGASRYKIDASGNHNLGTGTVTLAGALTGTSATFSSGVTALGFSALGGGYTIRNTANTATYGGITKASNWEGGASNETAIFAETGLGVNFYTNGIGTPRVRIDVTGNVGIGTTNPTVYSGFTTLSLNNATNGGLIDLQVAGVNKYNIYGTATRLGIEKAGGSGLYLDYATTNLGINTTSPGFKTTIAQDMTAGSDLADGTAQFAITGATLPNKRLIMGYDTNSDGYGYIKAGHLGTAWTKLALQQNGGVVLIGKTTSTGSSDLLQVNGSANVGNTTGNNNFRITASTTGLSRLIASDGSDAGYIDYDHATDSWIIRTAGTTALTIASNQAITAASTVTSTQYKLSALNVAPSSATDTGTLGEIRVTADFIFVCTATDTWKRTAISTW